MSPEEVVAAMREQVVPKEKSQKPGQFADLLRSLLSAAHIKAEVMLGGSFAKGTYLEGDHDIDVFVRFDGSYADEDMPDLLQLAISGLGDVQRIHGSRDYFQLRKEGFLFEIVPVLMIDEPAQARNTTDVSPFHVRYVLDRLGEHPVLADDIRLAKRFCKAAKVYGAESYIKGFSGHVLDNLLIHYGSFLSFLRAAAAWEGSVFIDPKDEHADPSFLNSAKRSGPLVLLDPIQPDRNAAAALSKEKFLSFIAAAKRFLQEPGVGFFEVTHLSEGYVKEQYPGKPLFSYRLRPLKGSKDVVGTKLFKAHEYFCKKVKNIGFKMIDQGFEFADDVAFCFVVVEKEPLPVKETRLGPPVSAKKDAAKFCEVHQGHDVREQDGRLVVSLRRRHRTLPSLFAEVRESEYWADRVKETF